MSNNNFIVSARKYRPVTFDAVVGQASITNTLKNAIKNSHLAQAYLFCGPRGVGKTTCARILAKTLNCFNMTTDIEACDQCESCKAFNESRSFSIHELDAASNNSVDDIRSLIDQVRIPPQVGRYSIYIIDEVHMLSTAAFNAFLKTLEEPPAHAIFILATTEKHKIIPTILSRCQIFDFNRIQVEDTVKYLQSISEKESVTYETEGLHVIAQKADGGMRDALSIYDQIVSYCGNHITYNNVIENLNVLDYVYYFKLTEAFLEHQIGQALVVFNEILEKGFDGHQFVSGLSSHFRDLLVCKDPITLSLLEVSANVREQYQKQAAKCTSSFLFDVLNICSTCDIGYKNSKNQRFHVELALIRLCNIGLEKKKSSRLSQGVAEEQESSKSSIPLQPSISAPPKTIIPSISIKNVLSAPSIQSDVIEEKKIEKFLSEPIVLTDLSIENSSFTEQDLLSVWLKFAETKKDNEARLFSMLTVRQPLLDGHKVVFIVNNPLQKEAFAEVNSSLQNFLRVELKHANIEIEVKIAEVENQENKRYTAEDKYGYMAQKNPFLHILKQKLTLDME